MSFPYLLPGSLVLMVMLTTLVSCSGQRTTSRPELPFKRLVSNAEVESRAGNYLAAADYYQRAYRQRNKREDLLYQAAELYTRMRDYGAAAAAYSMLEFRTDEYPLVGLYYGRALKQDGKYEEARRVLGRFRKTYNEADRAIVNEIVRNELMGIDLAQSAPENKAINLYRPGRGINTRVNEYGPVAIAGDQLYFTSNSGGQARLYQSRLSGRTWSKATVPPGFPVIAEGEFGTGTLSEDGRVFYFTICSGLTGADASNRCEIFRGERTLAGAWRQPERLGNRINPAGTNNAYPAIAVIGDQEHLFFASDRKGGRGGMDLYQASRPVGGTLQDFSTPLNLGPVINTVSDEITPFYDVDRGVLYFASNGHPSYGGLDIFSATGQLTTWTDPVNLAHPVNSTADDYGLSTVANSSKAYLTSNRTYGNDKTSTTETDIYTLDLNSSRARLKANIYDNTSGAELNGAEVTLYELEPTGQSREVDRKVFPGGVYDFDLQPGKRYRVVIQREGFQGREYQVATRENVTALYGQPVFLKRVESDANTPGGSPYPRLEVPENRYPNTGTPSQPVIAPPAAPPPVNLMGTSYSIQLSAQQSFDPASGKFEAVKAFGEIRAEVVVDSKLQRIMLGRFKGEAVVKDALARVQANGFPSAFVVRYDDGLRYGQVRL